MRSSTEDSPMTVVSSRLTSPRNFKGNIGSEGAEWERGRKSRQFLVNKSPCLRNGARQDHSHNDRLIGSRIRAFDWYQNHRPWMTLNGQNALWCRKDASFGAHCTNLNVVWTHTAYCQRQKCRPMNIVSGNIWCILIFAGVPVDGGIKSEGVVDNGRFWRFEWLFLQKRQQYYMTICCLLLACDWLQNEWVAISCQNPSSTSIFWLRAFDFQK